MADVVVPPKPEDDVFGNAFTELSKDDGSPTVPGKADPILDAAEAANEADAAAAEAAKFEKPTIEIEGVLPDPKTVQADGGTPAKEGGGGAPAATEAKPAPGPAAPTDAELAERFRQIMAAAPTPTPKLETTPVEPPSPIAAYSPQEAELIENYMKEWPDVYAAQQALNMRLIQGAVDHVFKELRPVLSQLQGTTTEIAQATHAEQLQAAVPDINEVAPKLVAWVDQQPDYLKGAFQHVVTQGSVAQVADLVKRFRAETGTAASAAAPAPAAPPTLTVVPPAPAAAKLAKGLAPVAGKRTGVQTDAVASDDFDGAFAAFARAG